MSCEKARQTRRNACIRQSSALDMPRSLNIRSIPRSAPQPDRKGQSWTVGSGDPYEKGRPKACLFRVLDPIRKHLYLPNRGHKPHVETGSNL